MRLRTNFPCPPTSCHITPIPFPSKSERQLLKAFLLTLLHKLFGELFQFTLQSKQQELSMECYAMDNKMIQLLIQGIVDSGEYSLEGISLYTRIPYDVIVDAACGTCSDFSITLWARIADLYTQVKPEVAEILHEKLLKMKSNQRRELSLLLNGQ